MDEKIMQIVQHSEAVDLTKKLEFILADVSVLTEDPGSTGDNVDPGSSTVEDGATTSLIYDRTAADFYITTGWTIVISSYQCSSLSDALSMADVLLDAAVSAAADADIWFEVQYSPNGSTWYTSHHESAFFKLSDNLIFNRAVLGNFSNLYVRVRARASASTHLTSLTTQIRQHRKHVHSIIGDSHTTPISGDSHGHNASEPGHEH